ncbi:4,5-dihydroxyphthalate decarboxylase [Hartmannibacter diazotrophicus]|uniref:4,5-dihydroxyphthalate decarboxylase n=1 Tax=Hartmannibacter diazotrophicus TaxID=1482074 RepID=A0A2C9DBT1_9HYPH|nr:ABC transporter substrate-binding protein [Hartmannibacter diazotrophicus]SON57774.1 4,5-dihydroxyphthalate decarboxylase [Hartmannibacter diazotrophicus]
MDDRLTIRIALGKHEHVAALKDGRVRSPRLTLEFVEFDPLPGAFRHMVRGGDLDVSEMALTTHLLAHDFGKPITALPIPLWRRLHHSNLVCLAASGLRGPKDLEGRRVGVRAFSQTTGVWIRGILATQYGVDLDSITWVTMEDAHVAEYVDPPGCERAPAGSRLRDLLHAGDLVAIMGERDVDPAAVRPVIPDAEAAAKAWSAETGIFPVNHVVSVRNDLLDRYPWIADELAKMFEEARALCPQTGVAALPYGLAPNAAAMDLLFDFAHRQRLTPKRYTLREIFPLSEQVAAGSMS